MKKAAAVLYIITGIFAILGALTMIIMGAMVLVSLTVNGDQFLQEVYTQFHYNEFVTFADFKAIATSVPTVFFVIGAGNVAVAILSFIGFAKSNKETDGIGIHVANLIVDIVTANILGIIAAILGLASTNSSAQAR